MEIEEVNSEDLFDGSESLEGYKLDIDVPEPMKAITRLESHEISNLAKIRDVEEYSANVYGAALRLYRGHASKSFKFVSFDLFCTINRQAG